MLFDYLFELNDLPVHADVQPTTLS